MKCFAFAVVIGAALAACSPPAQAPPAPDALGAGPSQSGGMVDVRPPDAALPPVETHALSAANEAFVPIEPSEIGVFGAPSVREALAGLLAGGEEAEDTLQLSVRESGNEAIADIVRSGMQDDSVSAAQIRVEFQRDAEGWQPINAYRRQQCARGTLAGQWSASPCP